MCGQPLAEGNFRCFKGMFKDLLNVVDRNDGQRILDFVRDIAQVFAVFFRNQYGCDVTTHGGQQFFF